MSAIRIRPDKCLAMAVANEALVRYLEKTNRGQAWRTQADDFRRISKLLYHGESLKKDGEFNAIEAKMAAQLVSTAMAISDTMPEVVAAMEDGLETEVIILLQNAAAMTIIDCVPDIGPPPGMEPDEFWAAAQALRRQILGI